MKVLDIINFPDYIPSIKFTFDLCNEMRSPPPPQRRTPLTPLGAAQVTFPSPPSTCHPATQRARLLLPCLSHPHPTRREADAALRKRRARGGRARASS